jgi:hypothetical protein
MANTKFPSQRSKMSRIKGFDEYISQLPLRVNVFHLYISLLYMVSQEVASHFYVFLPPMKNWVLCNRIWVALEFSHKSRTGVLTQEGNTLVGHSIISHGMHYPKNLGATAIYSASAMDYAIENCLQEEQQRREDPRK